jgi:hypothetical protein
MNKSAAFLLLLLACSPAAQAASEVINLNHRTAEEVLPMAQSVLGQQGRAAAWGNQLVVSGSPAAIAELRELLAQLDTRPRSLLISVDTTGQAARQDRGFRVDGSLSAGDAELVINEGEINGKDQLRIIRNNSNSRSAGVQQVRATEGHAAMIQAGQSVPVQSSGIDSNGRRFSETTFRNVSSGFFVTATVNGDRVQVTISSNSDSLNRSQPGVIDVQSTDTRVSGRLGEWIPFGAVNSQERSNDSGFLQSQRSSGEGAMTMNIMVEALD